MMHMIEHKCCKQPFIKVPRLVCDVQVVGMRCGKARRDNGLACLNSVTRKKRLLVSCGECTVRVSLKSQAIIVVRLPLKISI